MPQRANFPPRGYEAATAQAPYTGRDVPSLNPAAVKSEAQRALERGLD